MSNEPVILSNLELFQRSAAAGDRSAVTAAEGAFSFGDLRAAAGRVAARLLEGGEDLAEARVAFLIPPGFRYTAVLWGTWAAGGVAVPLATSFPAPELKYVLQDAGATVIVATDEFRPVLEASGQELGVPMLAADDIVFSPADAGLLPSLGRGRRGLILYTSGSTGSPKGVVWTHSAIESQVRILSQAWGWTADDRALLVLPLHHVHGLINVLTCALWNGAGCEILPAFDAGPTLERMASGQITVFMAVPTIYRRLISAWEELDAPDRHRVTQQLSQLRLMVSGSAALPVPTLDRWREVSGHTLLERYGMTEIGMALSNPYQGRRTPGAVGLPLPTVEVRLVDDEGNPVPDGTPGEIEVKGPSVFSEYWQRPEATAEAFRNGWFQTGDFAVVEGGVYRILGRRSVDIIKSGGEKVSALEVEDVLRTHPAIKDCAVVGIEDADWGERVVAAVVVSGSTGIDLDELRAFARSRLAPFKLPRQLVTVDELPRNALGKVIKPRLKEMIVPPSGSGPG
jgi:malonyl-CoA/methylmalonyl-CoA synthetase